MSDQPKPQMKKFSFKACEIATNEQLEAELAKAGKRSTFFDPGKYDVVIDEIEYMGEAKQDPNWGNLAITFKAQDKTIKGFILLPFSEVQYGPKKTMYPYKKFKGFCTALGIELTRDNLEQTLKQSFSQLEKLKGASVSIEVGYQKGYVKYAGKTESGGIKYALHTQDGNTVCDGNKLPLAFPDRAAAISYAAENGIAIDEYAQVLNYTPSSSGSGLKTGDANW